MPIQDAPGKDNDALLIRAEIAMHAWSGQLQCNAHLLYSTSGPVCQPDVVAADLAMLATLKSTVLAASMLAGHPVCKPCYVPVHRSANTYCSHEGVHCMDSKC